MSVSLNNRVAIITGGGSGIGFTFARKIHAAGCKIFIADIALHPATKKWIESLDTPSDVLFQQTDVTDWSQLERAFDVCIQKFGLPTIIVPAAGVFEPNVNSFWNDRESDGHYKIFDINLNHPIKTTRIAIRYLVQAKSKGTIIFVSSIAGQRSTIVTPLYTASKHAINSFIRGMAPLEELAGIKVAGVAPGTVATPLYTEHAEAQKFLDKDKDFLLPPEVVADAMFALMTEEKYKSGTILEVCDISAWREVQLLNDPGPSGPASTTSRKHEALKQILPFLNLKDKADLQKTPVIGD